VPGDLAGRSVLVVDDDPETLRLLAAILRRGGLQARTAASGELALLAAALDPPDLVLVDVDRPAMSSLEVCRRFQRDEPLRRIPIIFVSRSRGTDDKVAAFRAGAVDYVTRPFQDQEILARVLTHLRLGKLQAELISQAEELERRVGEQVQAVTASQRSTIYALAKLVETRDLDTGHHIERVQALARALAESMRRQGAHPLELTPAFIDDLEQASALHDIGKVGTPDAVLLKPGRLTSAEFTEMQQHCLLGARTLANVLERHPENQFLRMGVDVARSHHERWDGAGYPDQLAGTAIPLVARLVALADFYDALASDRVYRPSFGHEATTRQILAGSGTHFDPEVVAAFDAVQGEFRRIGEELRG